MKNWKGVLIGTLIEIESDSYELHWLMIKEKGRRVTMFCIVALIYTYKKLKRCIDWWLVYNNFAHKQEM